MGCEIISLASREPSGAAADICSVAGSDRVSSGEGGLECSASIGEIYEQFHDRILRLAVRITRNRQDAEDVVQECFMQVFLHLDSFSGKSKLSTWISRIAINAALMKIRRRRRCECSLDERVEGPLAKRPVEIGSDDPTADELLLRGELAQILAEELAQLSPKHLRVVKLYYFEDLSPRECAQALGISLSSARSQILRARVRLRPALDKRFRRPNAPSRLFRYPRCSFPSLGRGTAGRTYAAARPPLRRGDMYETRMVCGD